MQGTNNGAPLPGAPAPTNGTVDLAGYFDQKTFVEQIGLQAIVMPQDEWPVSFGIATAAAHAADRHRAGERPGAGSPTR